MEDNRGKLLEYARFHGLSRDHTGYDLDDITSFIRTPERCLHDLVDPEDAPIYNVPADFIGEEKFALDSESAKLLASTLLIRPISPRSENEPFELYQYRNLRLDLPLLRTDAELDVKTFGRSKWLNDVKYNNSAFKLDEEADEGFSWPLEKMSLPSRYEHLSNTEKLKIPKESALWLRGILAQNYTAEDSEEAFVQDSLYRKRHTPEYATPPLFPLTPRRTSQESSPWFACLEPVSDCTTTTGVELEAIERQLMLDDEPQPLIEKRPAIENISTSTFYGAGNALSISSNVSIEAPPTSSPLRCKAARMKLEEPITPPVPESPIKHITWSEELEQIIPALARTRQLPETSSESDLESFFNEVIEPGALQAEKVLQQEQLQEADSTKRMPVPILDFSISEPVWRVVTSPAEETEDTKNLMLLVARMRCHHWSVSKIEHDLPWSPFAPHLQNITSEDDFGDVNQVAEFLGTMDLDEGVDIETLTWKPEGLRILDHDEEEEDYLEPFTFSERPSDLESLLQKRKRDLSISSAELARESKLLTDMSFPQRPEATTPGLGDQQTRVARTAPNSLAEPGPNSLFSTTNGLDTFMSLQNGQSYKKPKLTHIIPLPSLLKQSPPAPQPHAPQNTVVPNCISQSHTISKPLPAPPTNPSPTPRPIIVSSAILLHRHHLIRHMIRRLHSIALIERGIIPLHAVVRTSDFTISPSTSLICTTIQEIKQKPLPGQLSPSSIRTRIAGCAPSCERLIVLVSANRSSSSNSKSNDLDGGIDGYNQAIDDRDCAALNDLTNFATSLDTSITITFIAGGEEDLARWITGLISATPPPPADWVLLPEVTIWELFLVEAGLNAYAAQAVLSELKAPEREGRGGQGGGEVVEGGARDGELGRVVEGERYGLVAFVAMGSRERVGRFEGLFGGRKMLERVGRVLDGGWKGDGGEMVAE